MKYKKFRNITKKMRYNFVYFIMKRLTPFFYSKLQDYSQIIPYFSEVLFKIDKYDTEKTPRPSTLFCNDYFGNKEIICCEIGVYEGLNSESLLKDLNLKKLILIDSWNYYNGLDHLYKNLNERYEKVLSKFGKNKKVLILKGLSNDMLKLIPNNYLDFVYIDANHSYTYVYDDLELSYSKVKYKGLICGHNIMTKDVLNAVLAWSSNHKLIPYIIEPDFIIIKK